MTVLRVDQSEQRVERRRGAARVDAVEIVLLTRPALRAALEVELPAADPAGLLRILQPTPLELDRLDRGHVLGLQHDLHGSPVLVAQRRAAHTDPRRGAVGAQQAPFEQQLIDLARGQ